MYIKPLSKTDLIKIDADVGEAHTLYQSNLTKQALYKTSDVDVSEELVQTTFFKTLIYLRRGGKILIMRAFLNHVLRDLITDEYRRRKPVSLDVMLAGGFDPGIDVFNHYVDTFDGNKIVGLIDELPQKYQVIVKMRYLQGLSLEEMANLTGQKPNTIAVQSHRGLLKLRALNLRKSSLVPAHRA